MRDLPRQLSADELAELFEGRTRFVERLAQVEDPLGRAQELARPAERILDVGEALDEARAPLEQLGELLGAQLPR